MEMKESFGRSLTAIPLSGPPKNGRSGKMEVRDATFTFEAQLHSVLNNMKAQTGVVIKLLIHPDDVPVGLLSHTTATRFGVAMVELDDHEEPVPPKDGNLVANASMLCKEAGFQFYMHAWAEANNAPLTLTDDEEQVARERVRFAIGVESLSELSENKTAQRKFRELRTAYEKD